MDNMDPNHPEAFHIRALGILGIPTTRRHQWTGGLGQKGPTLRSLTVAVAWAAPSSPTENPRIPFTIFRKHAR